MRSSKGKKTDPKIFLKFLEIEKIKQKRPLNVSKSKKQMTRSVKSKSYGKHTQPKVNMQCSHYGLLLLKKLEL